MNFSRRFSYPAGTCEHAPDSWKTDSHFYGGPPVGKNASFSARDIKAVATTTTSSKKEKKDGKIDS